MAVRRLVRLGDTVHENHSYTYLPASKEISAPGVYTPILALNITLESDNSIVIFSAASVSVKSPSGYGKLRITWSQGGLTHVVDESEGVIMPLGGNEYSRKIVVTGLTLGDAVGVSLEGQPYGETLYADQGNLYVEEW